MFQFIKKKTNSFISTSTFIYSEHFIDQFLSIIPNYLSTTHFLLFSRDITTFKLFLYEIQKKLISYYIKTQ
ncbi:unnamed protein product [Rhizophagus irregularis]|nr:unnamed protein product [Rhizophagus irregularis]